MVLLLIRDGSQVRPKDFAKFMNKHNVRSYSSKTLQSQGAPGSLLSESLLFFKVPEYRTCLALKEVGTPFSYSAAREAPSLFGRLILPLTLIRSLSTVTLHHEALCNSLPI